MSTATVEDRLYSLRERPKIVRNWFAAVDHKEHWASVSRTAFVFLMIGGVEALIKRIQFSRPELAVVRPEMYDQLFSMHGITMIFWYARRLHVDEMKRVALSIGLSLLAASLRDALPARNRGPAASPREGMPGTTGNYSLVRLLSMPHDSRSDQARELGWSSLIDV